MVGTMATTHQPRSPAAESSRAKLASSRAEPRRGGRPLPQRHDGDGQAPAPGAAPLADPIWGDESAVAHEVLSWARARVVSPSDPKSTARPATSLAADAGRTITPGGIGGPAALRIFDQVLAPATRAQDDPMNLAYIPSAPTRAAVAFDAATSAANIFGGLWETGAGAIFAENEALGWLIELLGWPQTADGTFVAGGTNGNLSALHAARTTARARRTRAGLSPRPAGGWKFACAQSAHSSIHSAAMVLDVEVVDIPVDAQGRLDPCALRSAMHGDDGVFAVVASAGSTNAGIVDDLAAIAQVCADLEVWLHVDGAYGGAGLCAPSARPLFAGIERADSFIVDPHKWLFAPYDCCALVYRDGRLARAAHAQHAGYLDTVDRQAPNPADLAIHLSRRARGLPFWFSLATHGTDRYCAAVERTLTVAREVAEGIRGKSYLRLLREPDLTVLLFERVGWDDEQYRAWSKRQSLDGVVLCLPTVWQGRTVLRLAFVNPATQTDAVLAALASLAG
jgi:glutamate/tyrosine decarboxylase-like PLP-dependent enzyme